MLLKAVNKFLPMLPTLLIHFSEIHYTRPPHKAVEHLQVLRHQLQWTSYFSNGYKRNNTTIHKWRMPW